MPKYELTPADRIEVQDHPTEKSILINQSPAQLCLAYEQAKGLVDAIFIKDMTSFIIGRTWLYEPITQLVSLRNSQIRPEARAVLRIRYSATSIDVSLAQSGTQDQSAVIQLTDIEQALRLVGTINNLIRHKEEIQDLQFDFLADLVPDE